MPKSIIERNGKKSYNNLVIVMNDNIDMVEKQYKNKNKNKKTKQNINKIKNKNKNKNKLQ